MTKLLVLSDSHGARDAIKRILNKEQNNVDAVIFLGDGLRDLEQALAFFPHLRVYSVAGNCDYGALEPLDGLAGFDQTVVFYTHGHMYGVRFFFKLTGAFRKLCSKSLIKVSLKNLAEDILLFLAGSVQKPPEFSLREHDDFAKLLTV